MNFNIKESPPDVQELIHNQADYIISQQLSSGVIPWYQDAIADPWDHVEAAMALDLAGRFDKAALAYIWMENAQNPDGSWYFSYLNDKPQDLTRDTNFSTYIATGMWLNYLITEDMDFLRRMWPTIEKGIDFALRLQQPGGEIYWGLSDKDTVWPGAVLTAASSTWLSIDCGIKIARKLGIDRPAWDEASGKLAKAIKEHPERFDTMGEDLSGHAMTWYYPILAGLTKGKEAEERILKGWQDFIIEGWGCKCFADRDSVCVAETCELILALTRMGAKDKANMVLDWILRFRDSDGVFYREVYWPHGDIRQEEQKRQAHERNTWTSAAAILAVVTLVNAKAV